VGRDKGELEGGLDGVAGGSRAEKNRPCSHWGGLTYTKIDDLQMVGLWDSPLWGGSSEGLRGGRQVVGTLNVSEQRPESWIIASVGRKARIGV